MDAWLFPREGSGQGLALQGGVLWLKSAEVSQLPQHLQRKPGRQHALRYLKIYANGPVARVTVDRIASSGGIFHTGQVRFAPDCGLWFGVDWYERAVRQTFERNLYLLGDAGVGGERSVGYGSFEVNEADNLALPAALQGEPQIVLSRFHPSPGDYPALTANGAAYNLVPVSGMLHSPDSAAQPRKRLWLLGEGSVIYPATSAPWGDVVDVCPHYAAAGAPPHPIWRYGLALGAGLKEVANG